MRICYQKNAHLYELAAALTNYNTAYYNIILS